MKNINFILLFCKINSNNYYTVVSDISVNTIPKRKVFVYKQSDVGWTENIKRNLRKATT